MRSISSSFISSFDERGHIHHNISIDSIRKQSGTFINNHIELYKKVAELQFHNPGYVLLFRGQNEDHRDDSDRTTILQSIFRYMNGSIWMHELIDSLHRLRAAETQITSLSRQLGDEKYARMINKIKVFRWSVIQHYNLGKTPLLDVTQSLRVAASFACDNAHGNEEVYLYVIAVPSIPGSITADIDTGIQIVRLSSACHPNALRPHIQEGYLVGDFPDIDSIEQKMQYPLEDIDVGKRLLAKFRLNPRTFWNDSFPQITHNSLYPDIEDDFYERTQRHRDSWS